MKIGLISDIHSDKPSLDRALRLLRYQGVDEIVCAGDLAEKGPDGDMVISQMQALAIPCVCGNHDYMALDNQAWLREHGDPANPALQARLISANSLNYLTTLPKTLRFDWVGRHVLVAHGSPWSTDLYIFPATRPEQIENVILAAEADIVVLGHTHLPMEIHMDTDKAKGRILNPGSVCGPLAGGSHTCGVLTLPSGDFEVFTLNTGSNVPHTIRTVHDA